MTEIRKAQLTWLLAMVPAVLLASLLFNRVLWSWNLDCFLSTPFGASFPASYARPSLTEIPGLMLNLYLLGFLTILGWPLVVRLLPIVERTAFRIFVCTLVLLFGVQLVIFKLGMPWNLGFGLLGGNATFECFRSFLAEWLGLGVFFVLPRILVRSLRPGVFLRHLPGSPYT